MRSGADRHQEAVTSAPSCLEDKSPRWAWSGPSAAPGRHGQPLCWAGELAGVPLASLREETGPARPPPRVQSVFSEPGSAQGSRVGPQCKVLLERQFPTLGGQGQEASLRWPDRPGRGTPLQSLALARPVPTAGPSADGRPAESWLSVCAARGNRLSFGPFHGSGSQELPRCGFPCPS